jgi:hypothetical protein
MSTQTAVVLVDDTDKRDLASSHVDPPDGPSTSDKEPNREILAIRSGAQAMVTDNLCYFPDATLQPLGMEAVSAYGFVLKSSISTAGRWPCSEL